MASKKGVKENFTSNDELDAVTAGDTTSYYKCSRRRMKQCTATGSVSAGKFKLHKEHNHPPNAMMEEIMTFKAALLNAVISSLRGFRIIYDEISVKHGRAAAELPFKMVESSMQRWRTLNCPPLPMSLLHYVEQLNGDKWKMLRSYGIDSTLDVNVVPAADGSVAVGYADCDYITSLRPSDLYIDATFKVCPLIPKVLQLLTIMGKIDNSLCPIAWYLMERKTAAAYIAVFHHFSTVFAPPIQPASFTTDYETALSTALQATYPDAQSGHCYFHYCQCLMKKVKKLGIIQLVRGCPEKQIVMRKLMAVALLPSDAIHEAFNWIVATTTADVKFAFTGLFKYFVDFWLNKITPHGFSVFGLARKTNNHIESYHRVLRKRMGIHPTIWQFTESLLRLQEVSRNNKESLDRGLRVSRPPKKETKSHSYILQQMWELFQNNFLDIQRFLPCASHLLRAFGNNHVFDNIDQLDIFAPAFPVAEIHLPQVDQLNMEEEFNEIPLLYRQHEGHGEIVIIPDLVFPTCGFCNNNLMNAVSLPCGHWFACSICAINFAQLAIANDADLRCTGCIGIVTAFYHYRLQ